MVLVSFVSVRNSFKDQPEDVDVGQDSFRLNLIIFLYFLSFALFPHLLVCIKFCLTNLVDEF